MARMNRIKGVGVLIAVVVKLHHGVGLLDAVLKLALADLSMRSTVALGCVLVDFAIMGNHVHLVFFIPEPPADVPDEELLHASEFLNGQGSDAHREFAARMADPARHDGARRKAIALRNDVSWLVHAIDQRLARHLNDIGRVAGRVIEDRFHSSIVAPSALVHVAVYDALNPARAGLESVPGQYPFTLYASPSAGWRRRSRAYTG